ncbi:BCCT family transporter [Nanchangia anserum]|uniref:BCCT family transporter n=1 Tax=Nanchangia anserum TaxID=2692125 RepID=A0A8I0KTK1_9ACTO|nr:BCCT family transporter [Nanchangia anserum]MBD3688703.1 BCCT family transporter [Nanchangia anserum]QOX82450.1 BCCT family transporter [Nanchangia anserum]
MVSQSSTTPSSDASAAPVIDKAPPEPREVPDSQADSTPPAGLVVRRAVFWPSVIILVALVVLAITVPHQLHDVLSWLSARVTNNLSWYYVLIASGFVVFALGVAFSRLGDLKLGRDDEDPEYSTASWFAMLFAAGMGIGLVFYGAAEPLSHFANPRPGLSGSDATLARDAMGSTFLHWGLHPWSIYVVVGLAVAYSSFRRGRPMSLRWSLEPLFGERVTGKLGDTIDGVAIVGTLLGIATSLGFGVVQVAAGTEFLGGPHATKGMLIALVVVISTIAGISAVSGIGRGIQWLSSINLILAVLLALAILALGNTTFMLSEYVSGLGAYLGDFINRSLRTLPFQGPDGTQWLSSWTTYYWGWWISWSPFVGIFIARISRGRTVREFIVGVVAVPVLVTTAWFAILGGNALYQVMFAGKKLIGPDGTVNTDTVLFQSFSHMPAGALLSGLAMIIVVIFFITSSDSGSFVMSMLSAGGNPDPAVRVRLTWAVLTGAVTAAMMSTGESSTALAALQSLAILVALPFSVIMIGMCQSMIRAMRHDHWALEREKQRAIREMLVTKVKDELDQGDDGEAQPIPVMPSGDRTQQVLKDAKRFFTMNRADRRVPRAVATSQVHGRAAYRGPNAPAAPPPRDQIDPS